MDSTATPRGSPSKTVHARRIKKLQGAESYHLRISDYRVLLTIDDQRQQVMIDAIGHRREVYR